jgi:hypothetical protein
MEEFTPEFCSVEIPDLFKQELKLLQDETAKHMDSVINLHPVTFEMCEKVSKIAVLAEPSILFSKPYIYTARVSIPSLILNDSRIDFELYYYHNDSFHYAEFDSNLVTMVQYEIIKRVNEPFNTTLTYKLKFNTSSSKFKKSVFVLCLVATNTTVETSHVLHTSRPFALLARKVEPSHDAYKRLMHNCVELDKKLIKY